MGVVALDFDGTMVFGAAPIKGLKNAVNMIRECGHKVVIHSCNNPRWIEKVLRDLDIRYDYLWDDQGKPIADLYIDDKGFHFRDDWDAMLPEVLDRLHGMDNRKLVQYGGKIAGPNDNN